MTLPKNSEQNPVITDLLETLFTTEDADKSHGVNSGDFENLFKNAPVGLHLINPEGYIIWANQSELETLDYEPQEFIDHHISEFIVNDDSLTKITEILKSGDPLKEYELLVYCKNGKQKYMRINSSGYWVDGILKYSSFYMRDISEKKNIERTLIEHEEQFKLIAENSKDLICLIDAKAGVYKFTSPSYQQVLGYTAAELQNIKPLDLVHPDDRDKIKNSDATMHLKVKHKNGHWIWVEGKRFHLSLNGIDHIVAVGRDITEQKRYEKTLTNLAAIVEASDDAIIGLTIDGIVTSWNKGAEKMYQYSKDEAVGKHISFLAPHHLSKEASNLIFRVQSNDIVSNHETIRITKSGKVLDISVSMSPIYDKETSELTGISTIMRDVTAKKQAEETIRHQALHDPLTGLPNRKALEERLRAALYDAGEKGDKVAVMFFDLDNFKRINDTLGHTIGDSLLREVANRLRSCIGEKNTVARLGGDEFIIMVPNITNSEEIIHIAESISAAITPAMNIDNNKLHISSSMGISLYPDDGSDSSTLLRNADTALYKAKELGRNRFELFNQSLSRTATQKLLLENQLRQALELNQFSLYYQPIIDVESDKIIGAEALIRWLHPELGLMFPHEFIPLAEETGIILPMSTWVLQTAIKQNKKWQDLGFSEHSISVNLSPQQFNDNRLIKNIAALLEETGLQPKFLELEITENVAMGDFEHTQTRLLELQRMGVGITIDDFGTGYSSLSYLKRFPVKKLKIDKSFVRHCVDNTQDAAIIKAMVSMAKALNIKVIAEGVETSHQADFLQELECDAIQGYRISQAIPAEEYLEFLEKINANLTL